MSATNIYQKITDRIISEMEKGIIPWQRPWTGCRDGAYSFATKRPYSLLNQMLLGGRTGAYLTFHQVKERGGSIRKGAKADSIYFYKFIRKEIEDEATGEKRETSYPILQEYKVFHIEDTTLEFSVEETPEREFRPQEEAEQVASDYIDREGIILQDNRPSNRACYIPSFDQIVIPMRTQFKAEGEFYSTLFHEMVHSTGHYSRLNRLSKMAAFGSEEYSKEELVAEIGAATIAMQLGFESDGTFRNSSGYIQGWLRKLKSDIRLLPLAAAQAEKAINLIRGKEDI